MSVTAFVGAGGKTTLMFDMARAETQPAVVSTTTKVGADQISAADERMTLEAFLKRSSRSLPSVTWVSPVLEGFNGKILGMDPVQCEALIRFCQKHTLPLFLEADGAARRHLKAPAAHEPVIPTQTEKVFWLAGLDVLRKPLTEEMVFRSELVSRLTKTSLGTDITEETFCRLILSPYGAFKGVPERTRRIVVLTHAQSSADLSSAERISQILNKPANRIAEVWTAALNQNGKTEILRKWKDDRL